MSTSIKCMLAISIIVLFFSSNIHAYSKATKIQILDDVIKTCPDELSTLLSDNRTTIEGKLKDSRDARSKQKFNMESEFEALTAKIRSYERDPHNTIVRIARSINSISDYINPAKNKDNTSCAVVTEPYIYKYDGYNEFLNTNSLIKNINKTIGRNRCFKALNKKNNDIMYSVTVNTISDYFISAWSIASNKKPEVKPKINIVRAELAPSSKKTTSKSYNTKEFNSRLRNEKFYTIDQLNKLPEVAQNHSQPDETSNSRQNRGYSVKVRTPGGGRDNSTRNVDLLGLSGYYENGKLKVGFFYTNTDTDELVHWRTGSVGTACQVYKNVGNILDPVRGELITTFSKTVKSSHQDIYIDIPRSYSKSDDRDIVQCEIDTGWRKLSATKLYKLSDGNLAFSDTPPVASKQYKKTSGTISSVAAPNKHQTYKKGNYDMPRVSAHGGQNNSTADIGTVEIAPWVYKGNMEVDFYFYKHDSALISENMYFWENAKVNVSCNVFNNKTGSYEPSRSARGALLASNEGVLNKANESLVIPIAPEHLDRNHWGIVECVIDTGWQGLYSIKDVLLDGT